MTKENKKNTVNNIVITVTLITGEKVKHIYKIPLKDDEAFDFLEKLMVPIFNSISGIENYLKLNHPFTVFNMKNVVAVEITGEGTEEFINRIEKKTMGFIK